MLPLLIPIIAAGIGAAGTAYAANQQGKAADKAQAASQYATDQGIQAQERARAESERLNAPYTAAGSSSIDALLQQFGLGEQGGDDWNTYVAQNPDVMAIHEVMNGRAQADAGQQAFIDGYNQDGATRGESLGQYHARVVGGRPIPKLNTTQSYQQTYTAPAPYVAAPRPTMAPLDISLDKYIPSPDYQYQQTEGANLLNAKFGAQGLLQSGAAMKAMQKFGQDLALGDYGQWRDYTTGQYNNDRNVLNTNYQYDNNFGRASYDADRNFGRAVYSDDRDYATGRADNLTGNLFKMTALGQASANNTAAAGFNSANTSANLLNRNAGVIGQSSYDRADAQASAVNGGIGAAQNLLKGYGTSYAPPINTTGFTPSFDPSTLTSPGARYSDLSTTIPNLLYR